MKNSNPVWVVRDADLTDGWKIIITFADESVRVFDFEPQLSKPVFSHLKDPVLFKKGHAEYGTIVWDDDTDIAPEYLYDHSIPIS